MLKVFICEDENHQRAVIRKTLENIILMEDYDMEVVMDSPNPHEVIAYLDREKVTGLYFLDIDLQTDINGIELASQIRERDPRGFIVFITNNLEMSVESFKYRIEAMDFIPKLEFARGTERVNFCLADAYRKYGSSNTSIQRVLTVKSNGRQVNIPFKELVCVETTGSDHLLRAISMDRIIEFYGNIKDIEKMLDERFIKAHRSNLVNRYHVKELKQSKHEILMSNGKVCYLSKRGAKLFKGI